jgi:hypothetical protein
VTEILNEQIEKADDLEGDSKGDAIAMTENTNEAKRQTEDLPKPRRDYSFLLISMIFMIVIFGVFQLSKGKEDSKPNTRSKILDKLPSSVRLIFPDSPGKLVEPGSTQPFQVEFQSELPSVGWLALVTDEGQTISDLVMIGSSMTSFEKGVPKTFPVLVNRPNLRTGYHMVVVVCTDAFTSASLPKFQEIESFMRISAMGGKLPRSDCQDLRFRL